MKKDATALWRAAQAVVYSHAAIVAAHGVAHARLHVELSSGAQAFVLIVIVLGPLAALAVWKSGRPAIGGVMLAAVMAGSLVFGVWNHFVVGGGDHVAHLLEGVWRPVFQLSAGLLALAETIGCGVGWRMWREGR
jgi:hypothetical protein